MRVFFAASNCFLRRRRKRGPRERRNAWLLYEYDSRLTAGAVEKEREEEEEEEEEES